MNARMQQPNEYETFSHDQITRLYREKLFLLFVPRQWGGREMNLPEALYLEERLSRENGSLGWLVTLCAGAGWFVGFMGTQLVKEITQTPRLCIAGSGAATGVAKREEDGYRLNGKWSYATGSNFATHFTANCQVEGEETVQSFVFLRNEVTLHNEWNAMGLQATASNAFTVNDLWVPQNRVFHIDPKEARHPSGIFQYPFLPFAAVTLAVNYAGMAAGFLEQATIAIGLRQHAAATTRLRRATEALTEKRDQFYDIVHRSWALVQGGQPVLKTYQEKLFHTSQTLVKTSLRAAFDVYPYCGMQAADRSGRLNKIWRDLFTASQHRFFL